MSPLSCVTVVVVVVVSGFLVVKHLTWKIHTLGLNLLPKVCTLPFSFPTIDIDTKILQ